MLFREIKMSWFAAKLNLKVPIRVFGDCDPNNFYFSRLENGSSVLHGKGPALLQASKFQSNINLFVGDEPWSV